MNIITEIELFTLLLLALCVLSQSIFGVGVLLWGTPLLLLLNYSFLDILNILLPISASISLSQIIPNLTYIRVDRVKKFMVLCVPFIILGLSVSLGSYYKVETFVVAMLIISGILRIKYLEKYYNKLRPRKDYLLPIMGLVHGISNLGGSILVIWASITTDSKIEHRTLVASAYVIFTFSQMIVIYTKSAQITIYISYICILLPLYFFVNQLLFDKISNKVYNKFLTVLPVIMGIVLILQGY